MVTSRLFSFESKKVQQHQKNNTTKCGATNELNSNFQCRNLFLYANKKEIWTKPKSVTKLLQKKKRNRWGKISQSIWNNMHKKLKIENLESMRISSISKEFLIYKTCRKSPRILHMLKTTEDFLIISFEFQSKFLTPKCLLFVKLKINW